MLTETFILFYPFIDFDWRHIFFHFFESRFSPSADDIVLWINGGPESGFVEYSLDSALS